MKFLAGMFGKRKVTVPQDEAQRRERERERDDARSREDQDRRQAAAVRARAEREAEETRHAAAQRAEMDAAFAERVRALRVYFPGDGYTASESRLSGRPSWGARMIERLLGHLR